MFRHLFLVSLLSVILASCASPSAQHAASLPDGYRVLVSAGIGVQYHVVDIGTTAFSNESKSFSVDDWNASKVIIDAVVSTPSRLELVAGPNLGLITAKSWAGRFNLESYRERLLDAAEAANADAILVIGTYQAADPIYSSNEHYAGYGFVRQSVLGSLSAFQYASLAVGLFDVESLSQNINVARTRRITIDPEIFPHEVDQISDSVIHSQRTAHLEFLADQVTQLLTNLQLVEE